MQATFTKWSTSASNVPRARARQQQPGRGKKLNRVGEFLAWPARAYPFFLPPRPPGGIALLSAGCGRKKKEGTLSLFKMMLKI